MSYETAENRTDGGDIPLPEEPAENSVHHHMEDPSGTDAAPNAPVDANIWTVESGPFQVLGYDHGGYFYLPKGTRQVLELTAAAHNRQNMLALAPRKFWESRFGDNESKKISWDLVTNALLRACEKRGVYDPGKIRGRGAWEDNSRSVLHLGDRLLVDGRATDIDDIVSAFIYEAAAPLDHGVAGIPLSTPEANRFAHLCDLPSWESAVYGRLLAGFCVVAPICGALQWRPHIWVTGSAGSGKTWVMDNLLRPAIGPVALCVQSNTTEAGLRQLLKYDARPVLFDEAEAEDRKSQERAQHVLELMRQASSETGADIVKGSSSGRAQRFRIRSSFAFSSIGVGAKQAADTSRLSVLPLRKNESPDRIEQFEHIKRTRYELMTPAYLAGLRARTIMLVPTIRKNAETFARAASGFLGSQRAGDQVGALLAGAYSLFSASLIDEKPAIEWIENQNWGGLTPAEDETDESRCFAKILETIITIDAGPKTLNFSVAEAVAIATGRSADNTDPDFAAAGLGRHGLKVDRDLDLLVVSNSHRSVGKMLADSPWAVGWGRILSRLPGAETGKQYRFADTSSRGTSIPLPVVFPE